MTGVACFLAMMFLSAVPSSAQARDERAVKVALVFNLTKYVEWSQNNSSLVIGFVGEGSMGELLQKVLEGKSSDSRPIHVVLSPSDEELKKCNVIYFGDAQPRKVRATLERVRSLNILTVGETESFTQEGGIVGLVRTGEQVQIQINQEAARESRLKISSRLLDLAVLVKPQPLARN